VNGRTVVEDGRLANADEDLIAREARDEAGRLTRAAGSGS
jgi:hypothetical protein